MAKKKVQDISIPCEIPVLELSTGVLESIRWMEEAYRRLNRQQESTISFAPLTGPDNPADVQIVLSVTSSALSPLPPSLPTSNEPTNYTQAKPKVRPPGCCLSCGQKKKLNCADLCERCADIEKLMGECLDCKDLVDMSSHTGQDYWLPRRYEDTVPPPEQCRDRVVFGNIPTVEVRPYQNLNESRMRQAHEENLRRLEPSDPQKKKYLIAAREAIARNTAHVYQPHFGKINRDWFYVNPVDSSRLMGLRDVEIFFLEGWYNNQPAHTVNSLREFTLMREDRDCWKVFHLL